MQPPPRKGSSVKFLKNLHAEQIAKLQVKNQTECELLEDLRSFIIKKSALEKSYCEALLKITSVYLNKKITTSIPDLKTEGSDERWNMWSVWRTVLEENEKLSKARLAAIEVFLQQIADDAKVLRMHKLQTTKKCVDLLASIQKEVQNTVQDVEKTRKVYFDEEHCAHDVRDKAKDIEARLKRKKGSFFQSLSTLQKSSAKVSLKREQMDDKSVGARNDYLLSLATANSHQTRYFVHDLQNIMQAMESNVYEKVQEYFTLIGRAELLTCAATQASYSKIKEQAQKLTREYNLQCLYLYYPVLKQHIQYEFEACDGDTIDYITSGSSSTALQFVEEVKDWLETIAREKRSIQANSRKLQNLIMLRENGEKSDPADPNGPDLDTKIDDLQEAIRKSEVMKVKTEAKIELLKKSNDENVRDMCKKLEEELGSVSDLEEEKEKLEDVQRLSFTESISRRVDEQNYSSDEESASVKVVAKNTSTDEDSGAVSNPYATYRAPEPSEDVFKQLEANWDTAEESAASATMLPELSSDNIYRPEDDTIPNISYDEFDTPFKCIVLYNYTAQNPDELTIVAGEELDILGEGDGDGWLRARNSVGQEGFVPCTYLESFTGGEEDLGEHEEEVMATGSGSHLTSQISFSSVDYTVNTSNIGSAATGTDSVVSGDSSASVVTAVHELETDKTNEVFDRRVNTAADDSEYCIALYDYESNGDDELSFQEGQVIRVLRKIVHNGIDDGWWEGELDGRIGLFPSLMVEECSAGGRSHYFDDELGGEPVSAPPLFTPPEVPDYLLGENNINDQGFSSDEPVNQVAKTVEKFSFEMSDNQQKQYNTQFEEQMTAECPSNVEVVTVPGSTLPGISINVISDEDNIQNPEISFSITEDGASECDPISGSAETAENENNDFNLGVTQIVITAPTPSSDSADKTFPPNPPSEDSQMSVAAVLLERRKSAGEINEADPPLYDATLNDCVDYPTTIIEEPEEEDEEEEKYAEELKCDKKSSDDKIESPRHSFSECPSKMPLPGRHSDSGPTVSTSIPSSYPNCVPEQLEPHQLQRLQELKESNA